MEIQDAYKKKLAAQLKEWGAQIDLLEAKMENVGADIKVKHAREIQELRAKQRAASEKMEELANAGGEAWEQVKGKAETIWDDLKTGIASAHEKFK